jgi:hypothetical protein
VYLSSPTFVTGYSVVVTLTYHHAIFSDRCTSSSLKCPYNTEQSTVLNKITSPVFGPSYSMYETTTQVYTSSPPTPNYEPSLPPYQPTTETYVTSSQKYENTSQFHKASTSTYKTTSPTYSPSPPDHKPTQPEEVTMSPWITGRVTSITNVFRLHQK